MRKQSTEQSIRLSELRVDNGGREGRGAEELYVDSISNGTHSELPRITPINGNSAHGIAAFLCSSSNGSDPILAQIQIVCSSVSMNRNLMRHVL
jgi:hypothetical protein